MTDDAPLLVLIRRRGRRRARGLLLARDPPRRRGARRRPPQPGCRFELAAPVGARAVRRDRPPGGLDLASFAADQDVRLVRGRPWPPSTSARPRRRHLRRCAAPPRPPARRQRRRAGPAPCPGAVTFRGGRDADAVRAVVDRSAPPARRSAFALAPDGASRTLPLYELALDGGGADSARTATADVLVVTPEPTPLHAFGERASAAVARLLDGHGAGALLPAGWPRWRPTRARPAARRRSACSRPPRSSALAAPAGPRPAGLPDDAEGLRAGRRARPRRGSIRVLAAGDVTDFPAQAGRPRRPAGRRGGRHDPRPTSAFRLSLPFRPVLRASCTPINAPAYLRAPDTRRRARAPVLLAVAAAEQGRRAAPLALPDHQRRGAALRRGASVSPRRSRSTSRCPTPSRLPPAFGRRGASAGLSPVPALSSSLAGARRGARGRRGRPPPRWPPAGAPRGPRASRSPSRR